MANKRKDRKRYSKGSREDYTNGGRVRYQRGREVTNNNYTQLIDGGGRIEQPQERGRGREEADQIPSPTPATTPTPASRPTARSSRG